MFILPSNLIYLYPVVSDTKKVTSQSSFCAICKTCHSLHCISTPTELTLDLIINVIMKTVSIFACVIPLATATRNAAELFYALPKGLSAETSECEFPGSYVIQNLVAIGTVDVASNFTNVTDVSFDFVDSETGETASCEKNSTSTNLSPGGAYGKYQCDSDLVQFSWGNSSATGMKYKVSVSETICK